MSAHKDLKAWQAAHSVVRLVLHMSRTAWTPHAGAVFTQLQRSALSIQLNIAEGYASGPSPRCRQLLRIAYASAVETEDLLEMLSEEGLIQPLESESANQLPPMPAPPPRPHQTL